MSKRIPAFKNKHLMERIIMITIVIIIVYSQYLLIQNAKNTLSN